MRNHELAALFEELANLLEFKGENPFKINSYRRAARVLIDSSDDVADLVADGTLRDLPGIGERIAAKIEEYLATGKMKRLEEARQGVPLGVLELFRIPGVGPKRAMMLCEKLHIQTIGELESAAIQQKIRDLPGMGIKSEDAILRGIRIHRAGMERMLLNVALDAADAVIKELKLHRGLITRISPCGSLRRMCETIGDVDILACGPDTQKIIDAFAGGAFVYEKLAAGPTKATVMVKHGPQVDLRVVEVSQYGAALQYFTGNKDHNVKLRGIAKQRGMKINEYGLFEGERLVASKEEEDIYHALGMEIMPPEIRENRGEIEAAIAGNLPHPVEQADIKGDLHVHSNWSDGKHSIEEMAEAAKKSAYKYIAITDHSQSLKIANGLSPERLREQMREIEQINKRMRGFKILCGIELDIKSDGSLDLPDDLLAQLDVVIAAVHSGFKQTREKMMERIEKAMKSPHVDIIAHPSGRLIGKRQGLDVDMPELIRLAAATGTAFEINSNPERLDLNDIYCRMAKELGVKIAVNTDAHHTHEFGLMHLGVAVARRGWLESADVINASAKPSFK